MKRDFGHDGVNAGDGVLTVDELRDYIEHLEDELIGRSSRVLQLDLEESSQLLADMLDRGVTGLNYLPPAIRDAQLPPNLERRAAELLFMDNKNQSDRITRTTIARAKRRYSNSGRTVGSLRNEGAALKEISELAKALDLS